MIHETKESLPGTVPVPNVLFDHLLPNLTDTELRIVLTIIRSTRGWREGTESGGWRYKQRDWISHAQFVKRTGRKSEAISSAIDSLARRGIIGVENTAGTALDTPEKRRRYIGRIYFRLGDKWITSGPFHPGKPKTTTNTLYNKKRPSEYNAGAHSSRADEVLRGKGWFRAADTGHDTKASGSSPDGVWSG